MNQEMQKNMKKKEEQKKYNIRNMKNKKKGIKSTTRINVD